jgi:hypothetical protein
MAYDPDVAFRVRAELSTRAAVVERKMFGGVALLVGEAMCVGVLGNELLARVGPDRYLEALRQPHTRIMDFTGRPMRGFVFVAPAGFRTARQLGRWLDWCLEHVQSLPPRKPKKRHSRPVAPASRVARRRR